MRSSRPMGSSLAAAAALALAAAGHPVHVVPADTRPLPPAPTMRRSNDLRVRISRQLAAEIEAHNRAVEERKAEKRHRRQMRDHGTC